MPARPADRASGTPAGKQASAKPCPICGKPATETSKPFCSDRCRDVDLNRWLSGSYVVPGKPEDDQEVE